MGGVKLLHKQSVENEIKEETHAEKDPETRLLTKILEMMVKKHSMTGAAEEKGYSKFKVRQWETIEDKLKGLDLQEDTPKDYGIHKDFMAQIQEHIREIIKSGKKVKVSSLSKFLAQEQKYKGNLANVQIKL